MVTMQTKPQTQWWRDVKWDGCLVPAANVRRLSAASPRTESVDESIGWEDFAVPTINQHGPSCCGQAWANWLEMMLRRYIGRDALKTGEQIDGYAIWKRAREIFYNGNLAGGLFLGQGFLAAMDLGLFPEGTILVDVEPSLEAIHEQLRISPMVQGHIVTDGWYEPNPQNGCLDHSKLPKPGDGGHATCLMGLDAGESTDFIVSQNSWGGDYGFYGYFTMEWGFWRECYIGEGPCTAVLPRGWESHDGWRKYMTRNAQ